MENERKEYGAFVNDEKGLVIFSSHLIGKDDRTLISYTCLKTNSAEIKTGCLEELVGTRKVTDARRENEFYLVNISADEILPESDGPTILLNVPYKIIFGEDENDSTKR